MKDHKIVAIVGATGGQGGGLARAILADPPGAFSVRAVTRRPESAAARELAALGAEIVAADLDRPETLKRAFDGAHAVFCVTNFWEHSSPERELTQAASMVNAVACYESSIGNDVPTAGCKGGPPPTTTTSTTTTTTEP